MEIEAFCPFKMSEGCVKVILIEGVPSGNDRLVGRLTETCSGCIDPDPPGPRTVVLQCATVPTVIKCHPEKGTA